MSFEQAVFEGFKDKYAANSTLVGYLKPGGFIRSDSQPSRRNLPRVEFTFTGFDGLDSSDGQNESGIVRLAVICDRNKAFGTGDTPEHAGLMDNIQDQIDSTYRNQTITTSGWSVSRLGRARWIRGPQTPQEAQRIAEFRVVGEKT